jgi:ATP-binding cassette, subfamily B, bacterial
MRKTFQKSIPLLGFALVIGLFTYVINGIMSLTMMDVVDFAIGGQKDRLYDSGLQLIGIAFLLLLFQTLMTWAKGIYRRKANRDLRKAFLEGVFKKNINEFNKDNHAKYVSAITNDLNTLDMNYIDGLFELILSFISFVVVVVVVARVNGTVLLVILLLTAVMILISNMLSKPLAKMVSERSVLYEKYTDYLSEVLHAFRIIKTNDLTDRVKKNFHERSVKLQEQSYRIDRFSTYIYALQNSSMSVVVLGIIGVSVFFTIRGALTFGGIVLIMSNLNSLLGPFQRAGELLPKIISSKVLFQSLDHTLKNAQDYEETITLEKIQREICFNRVNFSYGDLVVFSGLDLKFERGKKVLVTGPSGGGKSTLLRLIRKYHIPTDGEILVDDIPLKDITKESFFSHIANVDQNIFIFDDTLRNNLTLFREISDKRLWDTIEQSGLTPWIQSLPDGLDTLLKDNGHNISGGEKSRIAIARAILGNVDFLLLDEAFAGLDYKTARTIEKTLLAINDLAVINVSHVIIRENKDLYDMIIRVGDQNAVII